MMKGRNTIAPVERLRRLATETHGDVNFSRFIIELTPIGDAQLAELIEQDGRLRIARGRDVTLERYIEAVPDLFDRPDALDAALDVTLRSLSRSSHPDDESIDELIERYPELATSIEEAAALNNALWSTTGLRRRLSAGATRSLPEEFGPPISGSASGESRYVLKQLLGSGAYGEVYLAVDRQLSDTDHPAMVAVKILTMVERSRSSRLALAEEATKARRVEHPNVVRVLDRGVSEREEEYIVYEYVDGGDLGQWLRERRGQVPVRLAVRLAARISRGVQAAHTAGLVHCDLKPNNIMLKAERAARDVNGRHVPENVSGTEPMNHRQSPSSQAMFHRQSTNTPTADLTPKVADFGIAIRAGESLPSLQSDDQQHHPVGNLAYISPEQYRMEDGSLTVPSDVYALGGILFTLLTGELPNGRTVEEIAATHHPDHGRHEPPKLRLLRREIDVDLEAICHRAMATRPEDRYNAAGAFADDLEAWLRYEPIHWTRPSITRLTRLWIKRRPTLAASLLVVALLSGTGLRYAMEARDAAALAREHEQQREIEFLRAEQERMRADRASEINEYREYVGGKLLNQIQHFVDASPSTTQTLSALWAFDHVFRYFNLPLDDGDSSFDDMRMAVVDQRLQQLAAADRENSLEAWLWQTNMAFWLIGKGQVDQAEPLVREIRSAWQAMLDPNDPWFDLLDVLDASLTVRKALVKSGEDAREQAELIEAERILTAYEREITTDDFARPVHHLVLETLRDLYGPDLQNQPAEHQMILDRLDELRRYRPMDVQ